MASPEGNYAPGSVLDVEISEAKALVNGKYAEFLEPLPIEEVKEIAKEIEKNKIDTKKKR